MQSIKQQYGQLRWRKNISVYGRSRCPEKHKNWKKKTYNQRLIPECNDEPTKCKWPTSSSRTTTLRRDKAHRVINQAHMTSNNNKVFKDNNSNSMVRRDTTPARTRSTRTTTTTTRPPSPTTTAARTTSAKLETRMLHIWSSRTTK